MKRYRVFDSSIYAKSGEVPAEKVCEVVRSFIDILGVKEENIRIEDVKTGLVMTYTEFYHADK